MKKRSKEWAKSRKGQDRKSDRTRQKNKRPDIEKCDQTGSSEIPDRGETSEIPGLPSGEMLIKNKCIHKKETSEFNTVLLEQNLTKFIFKSTVCFFLTDKLF